ncbi:MAG: hypothetical protein K2W81_15855 [Sphingomonas sp.]|uniref:diacylglycerol/lipid kinase family protein n=1 Tax=Sphingomonas sp. TaxID=28214 RepID=UPI0025F6F286|nr:diacylglycerol kinase family protein [Sphingomonas sp.]MBY0285419.1 hypothetical protein [Sphingomonas sp.]
MGKFWLITNRSSGSTSVDRQTALIERMADKGFVEAGITDFPNDPLPSADALGAAGVGLAVLYAGDGTINAAIRTLEHWDGAILILPGGTMNLLARELHGDADLLAIIDLADADAPRVALPYVEAGESRAFVGLILGPAANWAHAREAARAGRGRSMLRAIVHAWRRTFGRGIRVTGAAGLPRQAQAVFVQPDRDRLRVAAIDARDWRTILALGWEWVTGDWIKAAAVHEVRAQTLSIAEHRPALGLFDGEPVKIAPDVTIRAGRTAPQFVQTRET